MAIERCPNIKRITLKTADALLIAIYGVEALLMRDSDLPWVSPTVLEESA